MPEIEGVPDAINCLECCFPSLFTLPGACATCGLSDDPAEVTGMDSCLTCEDGYEIGPLYSDCTGLCIKSDSVDYFTALGFGDLATSACTAVLDCYDDRHAVAPVDDASHGAGGIDAAPDGGQGLGRRARPHDDARGGGGGRRGRVLGASCGRRSPHPHPHRA